MSSPNSFLWHDYETSGADPARDRPTQFAARRTDAELNPIGEPIMLYCRPAIDVLPHPDACLLTGITPQQCRDEGIAEPAFARHIADAFGRSGTCGVGYNSIRFDDEVTRHLLYRNFHDPYRREWYGGNSRWDLIDVVRLWHALRPEGLEWPQREDGTTSFKLEHLSKANGLMHEKAHDALSDVDATIELARRLKQAQPRLFEHALKLRDKRFAASLLDWQQMTPVLHVSSKFPAARGCLAVIAPLAMHPTNGNCVIAYDLSVDPDELLALPADELRERVFAAGADLPEGLERIPLKGIHTNKSPMLAPLSTLSPAAATRWRVDLERCERHRQRLLAVREPLAKKVAAVFTQPAFESRDPELSLYGGFLPDADRPLLDRVRGAPSTALAGLQNSFRDPRYAELMFRYRARHYPQTLEPDEQLRWREYVARKLSYDTGIATLTLPQYQALIAERLAATTDLARAALLQQLADWPEECGLMSLLR